MPSSNVHALTSLSLALTLMGCAAPAEEIGDAVLLVTDAVPTIAGGYALDFEVSDGDQRAYLLYLPAGYDQLRAEPYPLVAMFHGLGGGAANFAVTLEAAGLRALADQQGKIVVFLHGKRNSPITEVGGWWNVASTGRDDVLYTEELLDHLADELNVDETRVFAGGHSLGGRFVHELGSRIPSRFRAIADVSGFYGTTVAQPAPPAAGTLLPVMIVHGIDDPVVPFLGGPVFQPTQYTYDSWYANNDCTEPTNVLLGQFWTIQLTECRASESDPILYFVSVGGLDHHWPTTADHYDASAEMLAFFDMQ
jgi:polyhydroxybutyrate depolymerase